jgi:hypothetical protein
MIVKPRRREGLGPLGAVAPWKTSTNNEPILVKIMLARQFCVQNSNTECHGNPIWALGTDTGSNTGRWARFPLKALYVPFKERPSHRNTLCGENLITGVLYVKHGGTQSKHRAFNQ